MIIIKSVPSGRKWGDKVPPEHSTTTIDGVKLAVEKCDVWEGGDGSPDVKQQYWRITCLEKPKVIYP